MTAGFQTQVYNQPAQAVAGDFASQNPYYTFDAGPGGLVAGASGLTIGRFAWTTPPLDPNGTAQIANSFGAGQVSTSKASTPRSFQTPACRTCKARTSR
jgi:hypothetical protein